ncbi:MAG: hypothetical protein AB1765_03600 [Candidatus Hydrogenedentota bacterium]
MDKEYIASVITEVINEEIKIKDKLTYPAKEVVRVDEVIDERIIRDLIKGKADVVKIKSSAKITPLAMDRIKESKIKVVRT